MTNSNQRKAVFLHSAELADSVYPDSNPFKTERAAMARKILLSMGMLRPSDVVAPEPATREELEAYHDGRYLDVMIAAAGGDMDVEGLRMGFGTGDCPVFKGMYEYAALATGATLTGARMILDGAVDVAFNPSGGYHHAGKDYCSGFCYVNDVVLGCMLLADAGRRVLFLDVDVHHGDGVQNAFYHRRDVCTVSIHETGRKLFPGTGFCDEIGADAGCGFAVNLPLPPGTYDEAYIRAFEAVAVPVIGAYDPDVIVMELGMDGLAGDPLAHLNLTNNAYAAAIERVIAFDKPILATGGGGYHPENTARGWALAWSIFTGQDDGHDAMAGMGGVMLGSTEWGAGLRDRVLAPSAAQREAVEPAVDEAIAEARERVFGHFGL